MIQNKPKMIVFVGIPASGKSTYYREHFSYTFCRVNLDSFKNNKRFKEECTMYGFCQMKTDFVVDNTNLTIQSRKHYIELAKNWGYSPIAYYFIPNKDLSIERNKYRTNNVPNIAIYSVIKKIEEPSLEEGFDGIVYVDSGSHKTRNIVGVAELVDA